MNSSKRVTLKAMLVRGKTRTPATLPPHLVCPDCGSALPYSYSFIGGVNPREAEQWDYFHCGCGVFQFRHRTRTLRRV